MEYTIVCEKSVVTFYITVNEYLADGWKPQGGVFVVNEKNNVFSNYYQAMIRES